ncbi:hypothetical protein [Longimicrobium sp.]|uniref:hypothetical protein n=1 Tax=Longimicrobium sp. TaxID=2029185 RepID=UPI002CA4EF71|nr:hypothetical protein [Longimicrobium sp.]HSU16408.1 hypothetical protein [Longimicrobium sp.]
MKKLTLGLDALQVESFDTGDAGRGGTVRGHDTQYTEWCNSTYAGCSVKHCESQIDSCDPCNLTPFCAETDLCAETEAPVC